MLPPVAPVVTVEQDFGGLLESFAARVTDYKRYHVVVRLQGECASACTLVTALSPKRLCVGPKAKLEFHQAYTPNRFDPNDTTIRAEPGTRFLMQAYPAPIKRWIARHGGLTSELITLEGSELQAMFRHCP